MLTVEKLKEVLFLDETDYKFYWRVAKKGIVKGMQAGSFDAHGYGQIVIDRKVYKEHRLVWLYKNGSFPDGQIDHLNHDRRDNRIENLRVVSNTENQKNKPIPRNNKTGYVGVSFSKSAKKYEAYITVNGKRKNLGLHETAAQAFEAREKANKEFGFHENHGKGRGISKPKIRRLTGELLPHCSAYSNKGENMTSRIVKRFNDSVNGVAP